MSECGPVTLGDDGLHPLVLVYKKAVIDAGGNYYAPAPWAAFNNIVLFSRVIAFPSFDTDGAGEYTSVDLRDKRIISAIAGNAPMDVVAGQISLNPTTGKITSIYPDQTHTIVIGAHINGYGDNEL